MTSLLLHLYPFSFLSHLLLPMMIPLHQLQLRLLGEAIHKSRTKESNLQREKKKTKSAILTGTPIKRALADEQKFKKRKKEDLFPNKKPTKNIFPSANTKKTNRIPKNISPFGE
ncbi:hypothetical protein PR048_014175 [Dryococelus australis]|uniref:Uncharacterized protein n=1 Tax=Dryococelus australis TaxID=614101 RepID=A0ABQ9HDK5_9NEOP|nr:hypothetical protein PR048_014175 [Dryococelus australis]